MDASTVDTRKGGASHAAQSFSASTSSTSAQTKTRNRAQRRSFRKAKSNNNNAVSENENSPSVSSTAQRAGNQNWNRPSSALPSIDQVRDRLGTGPMYNIPFPPVVPSVQVQPASAHLLAIRTVERPNQPPVPLPAPGQAHDTSYRRDDGSTPARASVTSGFVEAVAPSTAIYPEYLEETPEYMLHLTALIAEPNTLEKAGYVLNPLSIEDFELKKRCSGCGTTMAKLMRLREMAVEKKEKKASEDRPIKSDHNAGEDKEPSQTEKGDGKCENDGSKTTPKKKVLHCKFHPGTPMGYARGKIWSCCRQPMSADPCSGAAQHIARFYLPGQMQRLWQFYPTPNTFSPDTRAAVAIDCEMGQAASGDSELIRLTLIDYFSSAVLIDSLVYPTVQMEHYRTRFSGVTSGDMESARKQGTCILGRDSARFAMWKYVGPQTVVVGHSAHNDLESLRWIHPTVVDTHIIESLLEKEKKSESKKDGKETTKKDQAAPPAKKSDGNEHEAEHQLDKEQGQKTGTGSKEPEEPSNPRANSDETRPDKAKQGRRKMRIKGSGTLSLKTLARERLGRDIQNAGNKGHDSLEDALAARDLVHWHIVNRGKVGLGDGQGAVV
ncbi:hypothetical protein GX51_05251 [Blastomyces parvus]|uniref:Exonuclease domain-containing protein n=1 Tax=Blastomyces parvus TaxID=2060905 RepID=A0A2B7WPZ4_9EURO|nr:hypothetical protein GX51_05251 [Blastomyces parvus]